jgi:hypothetical protein
MGKLLLWILASGFVTNLIWENAQAPLYEGYKGFGQHFIFCFVASIVDGVIIVVFYLIVSVIRRNRSWLFSIRIGDIIILVILGILTAIAFEKWALSNGTWSYDERMPMILGLGLMPLLQLSILSIISIYLVKVPLQQRLDS